MTGKHEIFQSLKQQILHIEGFKEPSLTEQTSLGRINEAFPNNVFPFSALHEFFCSNKEQVAASSAFIAALLSSHPYKTGTIVWISSSFQLFPPSLKWFGIQPHQFCFFTLKRRKTLPGLLMKL
jgi:protein ImuA